MDLYPTFLDAAGLKLTPDQHADGQSLLPVFKGTQKNKKRRLVFHYPHYTSNSSPYSSIIDGDFKLIHFYNDEEGAYLLFDLSKDLSEQNNLSIKEPKITQKLAMLLEMELKKMDAELPIPNPNYQADAKNFSNLKSNYSRANRDREKQKKKIDNSKI
ncbi:DUF4976 domain-containing protein [Polaribacter sp. Q13]|nr:sulfatase/phosphatase domain-containing protein [Polaribacter sp. Q13]QVY66582.1 DUF4976 domain-containing protein [Polaribacter sp. Q13]